MRIPVRDSDTVMIYAACQSLYLLHNYALGKERDF